MAVQRNTVGRPAQTRRRGSHYTLGIPEPFDDLAAQLVVVSPHLDDAVLSAFALLQPERNAQVVTIFTGAPTGTVTSWDRERGFTSAADHMAARHTEEREVMASLGIVHIELGFAPVEYRDGAEPDHTAIVTAVLDNIPAGSMVALPVGAGGRFSLGQRIAHRLVPSRKPAGGTTPHVDHVFATDVLLPVLLARRQSVLLYEDVPYLWAGPGDQRAADLASLNRADVTLFAQAIDREHKAAAINRYRSQASAVVLRPPDQIASALPPTERFWLLQPLKLS